VLVQNDQAVPASLRTVSDAVWRLYL